MEVQKHAKYKKMKASKYNIVRIYVFTWCKSYYLENILFQLECVKKFQTDKRKQIVCFIYLAMHIFMICPIWDKFVTNITKSGTCSMARKLRLNSSWSWHRVLCQRSGVWDSYWPKQIKEHLNFSERFSCIWDTFK